MHQLAPISPALHLGARRVLVIGVGSASSRERPVLCTAPWPSLAQIAGHMLNAIFIDTLDMDLERLRRVNRTIACIPPGSRKQHDDLRVVETLIVRPSRSIDEIASAHAEELPRAMRLLMRRAGMFAPGGARALSYLLFERGYCRHLMRLGFSDATAQRPRILEFLGYGSALGARQAPGACHRMTVAPEARASFPAAK